MAIDSHMHINSIVVDNKDELIESINNNSKIDSVINVGLNNNTSSEIVKISRSNKKFYSAVGIHPLYIDGETLDDLFEYAVDDKVVAIGEIGIDTQNDSINKQKIYLIEQIKIANELKLPVIIHSNNANKLVIEIFEKYVKPLYGCVFHCFQPDLDDLAYLVSNGYYISFAGRVTYLTAKKSIEVAKIVPDELFLVETDSPYISPEPLRSEINRTENIKYIIQKIADVRETSYEQIENITRENTRRLFKKIK